MPSAKASKQVANDWLWVYTTPPSVFCFLIPFALKRAYAYHIFIRLIKKSPTELGDTR